MKFCIACGGICKEAYKRVFSVEIKGGRITTPDACLCKSCLKGDNLSFRLITKRGLNDEIKKVFAEVDKKGDENI